jgi:hypothetical protein
MYLQKMQKSQGYGSTDPDPYQNVTDPQHWHQLFRTVNMLQCQRTVPSGVQ